MQASLNNIGTEKKLGLILERAAKLLPAEVGEQLLAATTPEALSFMVAAIAVWGIAHIFGVGEIADVVLLVVGYAALGGVASEAAEHIGSVIKITKNASVDSDINDAAKHLAAAITLVGVQSVLVILLRKSPGETFKTVHGKPMKPYKQWNAEPLPKNGSFRYQPKVIFTRKMNTGSGRTDALGNIRIGRAPGGKVFHGPTDPWRQELRATLHHEKVHQFLSPKFYLLRKVRIYIKQSAYQRSFLLRYIEEALAETVAKIRGHGWSRDNLFEGLVFPLENGYGITITQLRTEASGIFLGPVVVAGMVFQTWYGFMKA